MGKSSTKGSVRQLDALLLAAVAHDSRTPLTTMSMCVELLRQLPPADPQGMELLAEVGAQVERLTALVNDLLDASRFRLGRVVVDLRATDLVDLVGRVCSAPGMYVHLDLPQTLPYVLADAALLERALDNLLSNARSHSPEGASVSVAARRRGRRVAVRVVDHGSGVDPEDFVRLFAPFDRLGRSDGPGLGLGLTISQGFCEAMGARVVPSMTPGGGLTMTVELEVADAAPAGR